MENIKRNPRGSVKIREVKLSVKTDICPIPPKRQYRSLLKLKHDFDGHQRLKDAIWRLQVNRNGTPIHFNKYCDRFCLEGKVCFVLCCQKLTDLVYYQPLKVRNLANPSPCPIPCSVNQESLDFNLPYAAI